MRRWPRFMGCTRWGAPPAKTRMSELGSAHHSAHARQGKQEARADRDLYHQGEELSRPRLFEVCVCV